MKNEYKKPASKDTINKLNKNMGGYIEGLYQELYIDAMLMSKKGKEVLDKIVLKDKQKHVENVLKVHSNVCYTLLCLCVQCRASFKSSTGIEKQYNMRRSVVTTHEIYKYLYGFTGGDTLWRTIEADIQQNNSQQCQYIDNTARAYEKQYAQNEDRVLRNVSKHFSSDATEFFEGMSQVDELHVIERISAAMTYLQPIHLLLCQELRNELKNYYKQTLASPMPKQTIEILKTETLKKVDSLELGLKRYNDIINSVMQNITLGNQLSEKLRLNLKDDTRWQEISKDNIGLHILYTYLDMLTTFRAFTRSEIYPEYRQNLAYIIVSAHEGFKKLYGFDTNNHNSFWERSIKSFVSSTGDIQLIKELTALEERLKQLSLSPLLKNEDMVVAFSHVGTIKKQNKESSIEVFDYFCQTIPKSDLDVLSEFLFVMNDILNLYNKVLTLGTAQIKQETQSGIAGYKEKLDKLDSLMPEKLNNEEQKIQWQIATDKIRNLLKLFETEIEKWTNG